MPVASENTDDLFGDDAALGDGESVPTKDVQDADKKKSRLMLPVSFVFHFENNPSLFCIKQLPPGFLSVINALLYFYAFYYCLEIS